MNEKTTFRWGTIPILSLLFFICALITGINAKAQTISSHNAATGTSNTVNSLTSVPAGALLVLVTTGELHSTNNCSVSSSPSLTWTKRVDAEGSNSGDAEIWTALYTAGGNITVTSDWIGASRQAGVCYAITGQESTLSGATASDDGQTLPSLGITTTRANSIILGGISDWNAISSGSPRSYVGSPTETQYNRVAGAYTTYGFYKSATTVGGYTLGLSSPSGQSAGIVLYEVRAPSIPGDTSPPSSFTLSSPADSCTTIDLSWTTPTDNVGVTGYEIFIGPASKGTTTGTTFTITGLTSNSSYSNIYVRATDAALNGTNSDSITVTTDSCGQPCVSIASFDTKTGTSATTHNLTSVPAGALLVLTTVNETDLRDCIVTSSPLLTWTKRADAQATHSGNAEVWTAVYTAGGSISVTSNWLSSNQSSVVYVVINYDPGMAGHAAFESLATAPSLERITGRDNSILFCATSDWSAQSGSRTYRNSPTENLYGTVGGGYTYYHYTKQTTTAGAYTMGLSAPTSQASGTVSFEVRCIPGAGERQNLIFDQNFEGEHAWDNFELGQDGGHSYSREQSSVHKNEGAKSYHAEVRSGCDGYASAGYRSEILPRNISDVGVMWYGFSIYFDEPFSSTNWTGSEAGHYIQWHPASPSGSATLALWGSAGKWDLVTNPDSTTSAAHHLINTNISRGWHHFVFKVNWASSGGYVKVWIDGTVLFDLTHGSNSTWNSPEVLNWKAAGRYLKFGMNRWGNCSTPSCPSGSMGPCDTWILYYDNLRIGNSSATYDDVAPVTGGGSRIASPAPGLIAGLPLSPINGAVKYTLGQNYPNPFNKQTTIQYTLPQAEKVSLSLFDMNGRVVKVLANENKDAGTHTVSFDAGTLAKGVYYYKMNAGDFSDVKKLTIQ